MSEPDYSIATNKAYETLINFKEFSFPIGIYSVLQKMKNVRLYTYSQWAQNFRITYDDFLLIAPSYYGFTIIDSKNHNYFVIYNEKKDYTTIRFTLAHELGHIILGHQKDDNNENKEANCFARNFLCPIPAVTELNLNTVSEYMECFYVSEPMAEVAVDLKNCDFINITNSNYRSYNDYVYCYMTGMSLNEIYGYPC